jgi:hypothetical protein
MAEFWEIRVRLLPSGRRRRVVVEARNEQRARVMLCDALEDSFDGWIIDEVTGPMPRPKGTRVAAGIVRDKRRQGRYTAERVSAILGAEASKKFRVEFVQAHDESWCLLLCHYRYCKAGWALATEFDVFDGAQGSDMEDFDIHPRARVPRSILSAYAKAIRNWKAIATRGQILDQVWYDKTFARSRKLQLRLEKQGVINA